MGAEAIERLDGAQIAGIVTEGGIVDLSDHRASALPIPESEREEEPKAFTPPIGFHFRRCPICKKARAELVMNPKERPEHLKDFPGLVFRCPSCTGHTTVSSQPVARLAGPKKISKRRLRILLGGRAETRKARRA